MLVVEHNLLVNLELQGCLSESLFERLRLIDRACESAQMHPRDLGRFSEAEAMFKKAIAAYDESLGKRSAQSVAALRGLATSKEFEGHYQEAETMLRDALAIVLEHDAPTSLSVAAVRADIGAVLRRAHKPTEALAELTQASDVFDRSDAPDRGRIIATAALSETQLDAGDTNAALTSAQASLARARKILPPGHFMLGLPLFALARVELAQHQDADAEKVLREAIAVRSTLQPPNDPRMLELNVALVSALEAQHRRSEAVSLRRDVETALRASHSPYAADLRGRLESSAKAELAERDTAAR